MTSRRPEPTANPPDLGRALRSLPRQTADEGFTARVLARLDEGPEPAPGRRGAGFGRLQPAIWLAGGLVAAALALVFGLSVLAPGHPAASSQPVAAAAAVGSEGPGPAPVVLAEAPAPAAVSGGVPAEIPAAVPARPVPAPDPARAAQPVERAPMPSPAPPPAEGSAADRRREMLAAARSELAALRRDHRRLSAGLSDLPEIGADGRPVLYVGGDEGLGLVVGPSGGGVRPAAYPGGGASL